MAFKLTKDEDRKLDELLSTAEEIAGSLEEAKTELEEAIQSLIDAFNETNIEPAKAFMETCRGFIEDIHNERQEEYDEKSERWQEGERGEAAASWLSEWESATGEFYDIADLQAPTIEFDVPDMQSTLEALPREMEV